jgi:hypothetical protein
MEDGTGAIQIFGVNTVVDPADGTFFLLASNQG